MDRNSDDIIRSRMKFIAIGAGALVLALIAFSGLSWCAILACGQRMASISVGYWELLGGSSIAALAVLFIRPLRDRFLPRQLRSEPAIPAVAEVAVQQSEAVETKDSNWRDLYSQLSNDEREMFKSIMKKYCDDDPGDKPAPETE